MDLSFYLLWGGWSFGFYILFLGIDERLHFPGYTNSTMIMGYIIIIGSTVINIIFIGLFLSIIGFFVSLACSLVLRRLNIPYFHR